MCSRGSKTMSASTAFAGGLEAFTCPEPAWSGGGIPAASHSSTGEENHVSDGPGPAVDVPPDLCHPCRDGHRVGGLSQSPHRGTDRRESRDEHFHLDSRRAPLDSTGAYSCGDRNGLSRPGCELRHVAEGGISLSRVLLHVDGI